VPATRALQVDRAIPWRSAGTRSGALARRPAAVPLWEVVSLDLRAGTVTRPPGLRSTRRDRKGAVRRHLADLLEMHPSFASTGGDVRFGGSAGLLRAVDVASPLVDSIVTASSDLGAVATSGIGRRSWLDATAIRTPLLDAATGRPAFTGIVQVTAIAPSGVEAEILAKTLCCAGRPAPPRAAPRRRRGPRRRSPRDRLDGAEADCISPRAGVLPSASIARHDGSPSMMRMSSRAGSLLRAKWTRCGPCGHGSALRRAGDGDARRGESRMPPRQHRSARSTVFVLTPARARSLAGGSRSPASLRRPRSRGGSRGDLLVQICRSARST